MSRKTTPLRLTAQGLSFIVIHFKSQHINARFRVENPKYILCDFQRLHIFHILLSLRCIAVRFLLFLLHSPDGKCVHEQNVDERQTHIAIQNVDEEIRGEIAVGSCLLCLHSYFILKTDKGLHVHKSTFRAYFSSKLHNFK